MFEVLQLCPQNGVVATDYLQCTRNGHFYLIEIMIASSRMQCQRKAYKHLELMVKII